MSILVLGAGELGFAVLRALAAHPSHPSLTVLLRPSTLNTTDANKKKEIAEIIPLGISTLPGDITASTSADLTTLFAPFHTIISCTGMTAPPGTQHKLARAALDAGVKRYFPWQYGVDYDVIGRGSSQDLFSEQLDVRDLLRAQEQMKWVILSTGVFTSFLFEPAFGVVDLPKKTVRALGGWEKKVTTTNVGDIGRVVAELACNETDTNGVLHIAGQTLSFRELADTVERVLGEEVRREEWSVGFLKGELEQSPEDGMRKYRVVFAEGRGVWWGEETWNVKMGMRLGVVEGWMREHMRGVSG